MVREREKTCGIVFKRGVFLLFWFRVLDLQRNKSCEGLGNTRTTKKNAFTAVIEEGAKAAEQRSLLPPDDASPQQNGWMRRSKTSLFDRTEYLDYLKRELKVDAQQLRSGYFGRQMSCQGRNVSSDTTGDAWQRRILNQGAIVVSVPDDSVLLARKNERLRVGSRGVKFEIVKVVTEETGPADVEEQEQEREREEDRTDNGKPRLQREALIIAVTCELALGNDSYYYPLFGGDLESQEIFRLFTLGRKPQKERLRGRIV